jgi:hypothetical protein
MLFRIATAAQGTSRPVAFTRHLALLPAPHSARRATVVCSDAADHALVFIGSNGILARRASDWVDAVGLYLESPAQRGRTADLVYRECCERRTTPAAGQARESIISMLR